jgi:hypothetical protein
VIGKITDDVTLPVIGAIDQVGGIERRLAIRIVGIGLAHGVENRGGGEGGHRLRQEGNFMFGVLQQQRLDLIGGVIAGGARTGHHQFRLLQHLLARIAHQELVGQVRDDHATGSKEDQQNQVELRK